MINKIKKIRNEIETKKKAIGGHRNELRDVESELSEFIETLDNAYDCLNNAFLDLSSAIDYLSENV